MTANGDLLTWNEFVEGIVDNCGTATFVYNGKKCGIEPTMKNEHIAYYMWYGDDLDKTYDTSEELFSNRLFDGKNLKEIYSKIEVRFC